MPRLALSSLVLLLGCAPTPEEAPAARGPLGDRLTPGTGGTTEPVLPTLAHADAELVINEVMASNDSTYTTGGDTPDWVEIVNLGPDDAELRYVTIGDRDGNEWTGRGTLSPGEYLLLTTDDLGFSLDADGDGVELKMYRETVDEVRWDDLGRDVSIARTPNLSGRHLTTAWPTPGEPNLDEISPTLDAATESVFRRDMVHRIDFTMDERNRNKIDTRQEKWGKVSMLIDGYQLSAVGLRLKGSASFDTLDGKPAFKVDVNRIVPGTRYRTLKGFNLHNGNVLDPTRARDHISYRLAREAGLMAPRIGWADVYINGEPYGIYIIVEQHDDVMIEANYPGMGDLGMMFEPNESRNGGWGFSDFGTGSAATSWDYEEGPIPPDPDMIAALNRADDLVSQRATDARVEELWEVVDQDSLLSYMAWESVVSHTDGYKAVNNWRVFIHPEGKVHLVPAGAEWTWDYTPDTYRWSGALASWCLDNRGCKRMYSARALEVARLVEEIELAQDFVEVSELIGPSIWADDRSRHSNASVRRTRNSTLDNIRQFPRDVRSDVCDKFPGLDDCAPD